TSFAGCSGCMNVKEAHAVYGWEDVTIRIKDIDKKEISKRLHEEKAKFLGSSIYREIRFPMSQSEKFKNKNKTPFTGSAWLKVNFSDGASSISLEESDFEGSNKEHSELKVDNFFNAVKMLMKAMPNHDYDYIEIKRDIYWLNGINIILEELPVLGCTAILTGKSKKELLSIKKALNVKGIIEPNFNINSVERYYGIRGVDYDLIKIAFKRKLEKELKS
ncbi:MAG: hypothetical protein ACP5M9_03705, partial [Candidatus Micrarchaeia archaeon]